MPAHCCCNVLPEPPPSLRMSTRRRVRCPAPRRTVLGHPRPRVGHPVRPPVAGRERLKATPHHRTTSRTFEVDWGTRPSECRPAASGPLNTFCCEPTAFANCRNGMRVCGEQLSYSMMSLQPSSTVTVIARQPYPQATASCIRHQPRRGRLPCFPAGWPKWWGNLPIGMTYWS